MASGANDPATTKRLTAGERAILNALRQSPPSYGLAPHKIPGETGLTVKGAQLLVRRLEQEWLVSRRNDEIGRPRISLTLRGARAIGFDAHEWEAA